MVGGEFYAARDLKEACELLARYGDKARVLAGGSDLMVQVNRRLIAPEVLVYVGGSGLRYIREEGENLVVGAGATHRDIAGSELVKARAPLLATAAASVGSPAIRNVGTLGGNLANASPAADTAVAVLALGGKLKLVSAAGERVVDAEAYFVGPGQTVLAPTEVLQEVLIPAQGAWVKYGYRKLGRRRGEICAVVSVAAVVQLDAGKIGRARIALGSVAPTPMLAQAAEMLVGQKPDAELIERVAKAAAEEAKPIDDVRATAWYRREATAALVKGLLGQLLG